MKVQYKHFRIPEIWFEAMYDNGLRKGSPPINSLSIYSRKQKGFTNPFESQYYPSSRGGMCECVIYDPNSNMWFVGRSWCSLTDNYCYSIGRVLAYQRAYQEYLANVPY